MPPNIALDRLVRKEVALGIVRNILPPQNHIGLQLVAPWLEVEADDVYFDYITVDVDGLAPARAEDAEAELAQKDETYAGQGRASVIDWSLKDRYTASDISRYRELQDIIAQLTGKDGNLPLSNTELAAAKFANQIARDTAKRRRKLDNRIEWLIMTGLRDGAIAYNDGKIKFSVDYGRPSGQHNQQVSNLWSTTSSDPIGDIIAMQQFMWTTYAVRIDTAIISRRIINSIMNSDRFIARSGFTPSSGVDPKYIFDGWGPDAAFEILTRATGINFIEYDAVYRTKPIGSNTITNTRFLDDDKIYFMPNLGDVGEIDDTEIGFAKTLSSPHPMGNWASGYYEWEKDRTDPWTHDVGTGIKAFPVFLHMEYTYVMKVL